MSAEATHARRPIRERLKDLPRGAWVGGSVALAVLALVVAVNSFAFSPLHCGLCHEMAPVVAAWRTSAHADVNCYACHDTRRPWYAYPQTLASRYSLLQRDYRAHLAGVGRGIATASFEHTPTIAKANCLACHSLTRTVTMRYGTILQHTRHAERNQACTSCHLWTAHPDPSAQRSLLLMAQCFQCHGRSATAKAPGTCTTCHPAKWDRRPDTHKSATWVRLQHSQQALTQRKWCMMCHEASFCRSCHGIDMPHPANWASNTATGHAAVAVARGTQLCQHCHANGPNLCSMCHHGNYDPAKGAWVRQHPTLVKEKGAALCMNCHRPLFCQTCHTRGLLIRPSSRSREVTGLPNY